MDAAQGPATPAAPLAIEVRRSRRRQRTVTAYRDRDRIIILIPDRFSPGQEREWVQRMIAKLTAQERRRRPADRELMARSEELSRRYLGGAAHASSVTWVDNQRTRWGSCTPADGTIRLSTRLRGMPRWVTDYVILHELAHLIERGHGPRFWALLESYPRTERARGFLDGFAAARDPGLGGEGGSSPQDGDLDGEEDPDHGDVHDEGAAEDVHLIREFGVTPDHVVGGAG